MTAFESDSQYTDFLNKRFAKLPHLNQVQDML